MSVLRRIAGLSQLPALALAVAVAAFVVPVAGNSGMLATAIVIGIYAVVALPLGFLFGHGGVLSLAQGSFAALGAYTAAILATRTEWSPYLTLPLAIALPALVAWGLARPILRLPPLALVIATLALGRIVEEVSASATEFTGGRSGLTGTAPLPGVGFGLGAYITIWAAAVVLVIAYTNIVTGSRGRSLNAVRHDTTLARSVGVDVAWELSVAFALSAGVSGAAGWFYVHYIGFIAPESLSFSFSAALLLMVVVGGRKSVLGPVIGAVFYILVQDYLPAGAELKNLIFGCLLAAVLVFLPNGLASLPHLVRQGVRRRQQPTSRDAVRHDKELTGA